jgi:hypothetical protein
VAVAKLKNIIKTRPENAFDNNKERMDTIIPIQNATPSHIKSPSPGFHPSYIFARLSEIYTRFPFGHRLR